VIGVADFSYLGAELLCLAAFNDSFELGMPVTPFFIMESLILKYIVESAEEDLLRVDGFDDCVIGSTYREDTFILVYSIDAILERLIEDGCTYEEAEEHFSFNIEGSNFGLRTPMYINTHTMGNKPEPIGINGKMGIVS